MNVLVVAHPDDEILWFDPSQYDRIIIVFGDFGDGRSGDGRRRAIKQHPLADKITHLDLIESNYWRDRGKKQEHEQNFDILVKWLRDMEPSSVTTHSASGEYGHADHILVHNACMAAFDCPVNGKDPALYRKIRAVYESHRCWTWS